MTQYSIPSQSSLDRREDRTSTGLSLNDAATAWLGNVRRSGQLSIVKTAIQAAVFVWMVCIGTSSVRALSLAVPNGSFELPGTTFVNQDVAAWQQTPKPSWYTAGDWLQKTGVFKNQPVSNSSHIDNCDGQQAAWLFADREAGLFQDYSSIGQTDSSPTHEFDEEFEPGHSYRLTVGVIGGGGGMKPGATLQIGLYYLDAQGNHVIVAKTDMTNSLSVFSNTTHLVDFKVEVPVVQAGDPWAGKQMGIRLLSTVTSGLEGGYWDLDNVRLERFSPPRLIDPVWDGDQFQFVLVSDPGLEFEVLASTDITVPLDEWSVIGGVTNDSGTLQITDPTGTMKGRYYMVREVLE